MIQKVYKVFKVVNDTHRSVVAEPPITVIYNMKMWNEHDPPFLVFSNVSAADIFACDRSKRATAVLELWKCEADKFVQMPKNNMLLNIVYKRLDNFDIRLFWNTISRFTMDDMLYGEWHGYQLMGAPDYTLACRRLKPVKLLATYSRYKVTN